MDAKEKNECNNTKKAVLKSYVERMLRVSMESKDRKKEKRLLKK